MQGWRFGWKAYSLWAIAYLSLIVSLVLISFDSWWWLFSALLGGLCNALASVLAARNLRKIGYLS